MWVVFTLIWNDDIRCQKILYKMKINAEFSLSNFILKSYVRQLNTFRNIFDNISWSNMGIEDLIVWTRNFFKNFSTTDKLSFMKFFLKTRNRKIFVYIFFKIFLLKSCIIIKYVREVPSSKNFLTNWTTSLDYYAIF